VRAYPELQTTINTNKGASIASQRECEYRNVYIFSLQALFIASCPRVHRAFIDRIDLLAGPFASSSSLFLLQLCAMLKAVELSLRRTACICYSAIGTLESASALRRAAVLPTLAHWRGYSSSDAAAGSAESELDGSAAADSSGTSGARPARSQTKEWRSWIDTKLDSTLAGDSVSELQLAESLLLACALLCRCVARPPRWSVFCLPTHCAASAAAQAAAAQEATNASAAAGPGAAAVAAGQPNAAPPPPAGGKRARGFQLEQQIYSIVASQPSSPAAEEAGLPEGVTNYGQLGMASDAPRFERASAHADRASPQRLHPSRIFFPRQIYSPAVRAWEGALRQAWDEPSYMEPGRPHAEPQRLQYMPAAHAPSSFHHRLQSLAPSHQPLLPRRAGAGPLQGGGSGARLRRSGAAALQRRRGHSPG
jgi:hypothetical protein